MTERGNLSSTNDSSLIAALCIAGTHSGCGKTTVSLGIMAALVRRGYTVQPFKVGPDFIDPGHHRRITGRDSHNLDGWIMSPAYNREIFLRYGQDADVAVVEGVMGVFDGFSGRDEAGSTAQMAKWLGLPVILVIDARAMARSAAAVAMGFARFDSSLLLKGVIFNRVGSRGHAGMLQEAMKERRISLQIYGHLPREEDLEIPSRHLGLVTDEDFGLNGDRVERLATWVEENLDLDSLIADTKAGAGMPASGPSPGPKKGECPDSGVRIGIASDEAFCFYYQENLRLLKEAGARLIPFSPLRDERLPGGIKGIILGGGYPELHCEALSRNQVLLQQIREFGLNGGPIYAECGGFMFLMEAIRDLKGNLYSMVGIFPMHCVMEARLEVLGYREITTGVDSILGPSGTIVKGHEFHYSKIAETRPSAVPIYAVRDRRGTAGESEGFVRNRTLGSYIHLHWGSNPEVALNFVQYCRRYG